MGHNTQKEAGRLAGMRILAIIALLTTALAGCSDSNAPTQEGPNFEDLDYGVQATDTTGVIRGVVVDEAIRPLAGVLINVTGQQRVSAVTRDDGAFGFSGLEPGDYFLQASMKGFITQQASTSVVAGRNNPDLVKITLAAVPVEAPYVDAVTYAGYLTFGASVGITSIGSTIYGGVGQDYAIWNHKFTQVPMWAQGELVWDQTQPAGGMLIWEMVKGDGSNQWRGHRETAESPALAFWNTTVLQNEAENVTDADIGIDYRFFGGPHPLLAPGAGIVPERSSGHPACTTFPTVVLGDRSLCSFGYGLTYQQRADAYVHNFYNFAPPEGWRYTVNGDPVVPA